MQNKPNFRVPSGTPGPGLARRRKRQIVQRRQERVQQYVDDSGEQPPDPPPLFRPWRNPSGIDHRTCARSSVALPPGIGGKRAADFTLEPGGLSVRENLLRLACGAVELWGLNESLSSSPLRPRWPLLFGIIQKVGKKIIQGGLTSPLEIPRQPPPGPGRSRARRRSVAGDRPRRVHLVVGNSYGE